MNRTRTRTFSGLLETTSGWLLALLLLCLPLAGRAQTLTQADFTGVIVPQYMGSATGTRLPVVYRATVSNLTPNTLYRYYTQGATNAATGGGTVDIGTTGTGAGNPLLINAATGTYSYTAAPTMTTAGTYETFTTDASGGYTGWFGFVNTGNGRFTAGNVVYPTITLAKDATPATLEKKLALDLGITVLAYSTFTGVNNGTFIKGESSATPKNFVALYSNTPGAGRPLTLAVVESIGVAIASTVPGYSTTAGSWNAIIPNTLPNGVRRIEELSLTNGSVLNCATDPDGVWPSGANTVNPAGGSTTAIQLAAADAPLNTGCGGTSTPAITVSTAGPLTFTTTQGTPSAPQSYTVSGTGLTAGITITAPAGFELSANGGTSYSATLALPQTGGIVTTTSITVRLSGVAPGTFSGNISHTSGSATRDVAVSGTVSPVTPTAPVISGFTPSSGQVGTVVTINGSDLTGATAVTFNGVAAASFTVVSATQITATVPAGATTGQIAVTTPGGTALSAGSFTVVPNNPVPTVTNLNPSTVVAGSGAFTLTLTGTGFTSGSVVSFNGTALATTFVSGTQLTAAVPATAIATAGTYGVTVTNPAPGGGTSAATNLVVTAPTTVVAEDFELGTKASYTAAPVTLRSGEWQFVDALIGTTVGSDRFNGSKSARIRGGGSIAMNFDKTGGAGTVTVLAALYGTDTGASIKVEISTDGGTTYSDITGVTPVLTNSLTAYTFAANRAGNTRLRISSTNTTAGSSPRLNVDDVTISDFTAPTTPTVLASPTALGGFVTSPGTASAVRSYQLSGFALTGPITVTAPAGFEVSLAAASGFASTITVPATGGTVYVRIAASAATGALSGNITNVSGQAQQSVAVSGNVVLSARNGLAGQVEVYPNPVTDVLVVKLLKPAAAQVTLSDLLGRTVLAQPLPASGQLSLSELPAGTYVLTVSSNGQQLTRKVVKR